MAKVGSEKDAVHSQTDSGFDSMGCNSTSMSSDSITDYTPKHGLDSNLSSSSMKSQQTNSLESGYGSLPTTSLDSVPENDALQIKVPTSRKQPKYTDYLDLFACLINLYNVCGYHKWSLLDFDGGLSNSEMDRAASDSWEATQGDEDEDFEALNAARDGDEDAVAFALHVAPNSKTLNRRNLDRKTVLHVAAEQLSSKLVRMLITKGADGAMTDLWGNTPLHVASRFGRADVVKELTTKIAKEELGHPRYKVPYRSLPQDNKNQMNNDGRSPIHLATQGRHADAVRQLAKAKVDLDQRRLGDGFAPLHIAVDNGDYETMKVLLEEGADLEVRNHKGETPQQLAYLCGREDMVQLCFEFDASPNQLELAETEQATWSDDEDDDMDTSEHEYYDSSYMRRMEQMVL